MMEKLKRTLYAVFIGTLIMTLSISCGGDEHSAHHNTAEDVPGGSMEMPTPGGGTEVSCDSMLVQFMTNENTTGSFSVYDTTGAMVKLNTADYLVEGMVSTSQFSTSGTQMLIDGCSIVIITNVTALKEGDIPFDFPAPGITDQPVVITNTDTGDE